MVQLLGIVGDPTGDENEEVVHLGAMQQRQALHTHPKQWPRLKEFVTAATMAAATFEPPSSVAGVAANDAQADAFMAEHGHVVLGGATSRYVRPFVRRKRLRSMLSALVASSDAATAASFWEGKSILDLSLIVPDMSEALNSMPPDMLALDAARLFQLSIVTGPLLLSMAACFWNNALEGKFGGLARLASRHEEELGHAYEAFFKEHGINATVPVLMGTRHVVEAMANGETTPTVLDVSSHGSIASGPALSRASGSSAASSLASRRTSPGSKSQATTKSLSSGRSTPKAKAPANESKEKGSEKKVPKSKETVSNAKETVSKSKETVSKAKVSKSKAKVSKVSKGKGPKGSGRGTKRLRSV